MTLETTRQRRSRRRRRRTLDPTSRIAVFSLGFLLILSEVCSLSSADKTNAAAASRWPPPRKARFFATPPRLAGASPPATASMVRDYKKSSSSIDKFYEDNKRLVHTGPNPLHN